MNEYLIYIIFIGIVLSVLLIRAQVNKNTTEAKNKSSRGCLAFGGLAVVAIAFLLSSTFGWVCVIGWLLLMAAVSFAVSGKKDTVVVQQVATPQTEQNERLPYPGDGYSYYELVGMQYRGLNEEHMGIHTDASAVAEYDNPHDPNAVSIRLADKVVAYIPREHNKPLHDYLHENGGVAPAHYRIWYHNNKYYGVAYIKDNGINQTYY